MAAARPTRKSGKIRITGNRMSGSTLTETPPTDRPPTDNVAPAAATPADKSVPQVVSELWTLTVDYAKQEIKDPVKGLGTYLLWGSVSMLFIGLGMMMLAIGGLRALQTETGSTFTGSLSFLPYVIVLVGAVVILGVFFIGITKRGKK